MSWHGRLSYSSNQMSDIFMDRYVSSNAALTNNLKSKPISNLKWRRVVFKISGTALAGNCQSIDPKVHVLSTCYHWFAFGFVMTFGNFERMNYFILLAVFEWKIQPELLSSAIRWRCRLLRKLHLLAALGWRYTKLPFFFFFSLFIFNICLKYCAFNVNFVLSVVQIIV